MQQFVMDKKFEREGWNISAVELETGLAKETLRVWERRYGFPAPLRDAQGERLYSAAQLDKLRVVKRLLDAGHRPGALMPLSLSELQQLGERKVDAERAQLPAGEASELQALMSLLRAHDMDGLRRLLAQLQLRLGLERFVCDVIAPFNTLVGEAWMRGTLGVYQEHSSTETVQRLLRSAIQGMVGVRAAEGPYVLLSTLPGEAHGLGLLMAEALFAAEGATCHSLGLQTPPSELLRAARAYRADIVALSFTPCLGFNQVLEALADLRRDLPSEVQLWVGGSAPALRQCEIGGVSVLRDLREVPDGVRQWRQAHSATDDAAQRPESSP